MHVIELAQQGPLVAHPAEDDAVGVGEHQADRFGGQGPMESRQHLLAAFEEQGVLVERAGEDRFDLLQRDAVLLAPLPRRQHVFGEPFDGRDFGAELTGGALATQGAAACVQTAVARPRPEPPWLCLPIRSGG